MDIGGGPDGSCIGGRYWRDPGAFHNGFKGFCGAFATSAIGFGGSELVGLCAAETENPRKNIPKAIKQVFWRIALFNILSITLVGLLVPYTDPRLLSSGSNNKSSVKSSPFVIAIEKREDTSLTLGYERRHHALRPFSGKWLYLRQLTGNRIAGRTRPSSKLPRLHRP